MFWYELHLPPFIDYLLTLEIVVDGKLSDFHCHVNFRVNSNETIQQIIVKLIKFQTYKVEADDGNRDFASHTGKKNSRAITKN